MTTICWLARDGKGDLHGPFEWLAGKGGFVLYAAEKALTGPFTLVEVDNDPARPTRERFNEALAKRVLA